MQEGYKITLTLEGFNVEPNSISQSLSLAPTLVAEKDKEYKIDAGGPKKISRVADSTIWQYSFQETDQATCINRIDTFIAGITPELQDLVEHEKELRIELSVAIYAEYPIMGIHFTSQTVKNISKFQGEIDVDTYLTK